MCVGKALSLICYCYPASERGSKLAGGWNSFSPWGDSGPSICQRKRGKNAHRQSASNGHSVGRGAPGSWSTRAPIVVQGACRPGCGVGGWVLQDVAVTRPGRPHGRVLGGAAKAYAARPQISASNAESSPTSRSFCSRFCRIRSRCAVVTLK